MMQEHSERIMKYKILIVNKSDIQGGVVRAAYRLHKSLLKINKIFMRKSYI